MSRLDSTVVILIVQITIPLLAALVLSMRSNHSASSRALAWGAIAVLLLTPCVFLPTPSWPSSFRAEKPIFVADTESKMDSTINEQSAPSPSASSESSTEGVDLLRLVKALRIEPARMQSKQPSARNWLIYGFIGLAFFSLLRFGAGWIALIMTRHRSQAISDGNLRMELEGLCAKLGCIKHIELRESSRIGSAATLGWFRPTILLAKGWRTWTPVECRAILAHEIGHVLRRDFLSRFLARLAGAIHGYHPLVRWLIGRLELRQELAADELAAYCVGGPNVYLRCLASLALKADDLTVGAAPTFHSRPRVLLRRIAMLQVKDDKCTWSRGWWSAAIVGALSVLTLGLHGQSPEAIADPSTPQPMAVAEQPGFDVSLLDLDGDDTLGFYTARLGKLFSLPGMKKVCDFHSEMITKVSGIELFANLAEIEQIAGRVSLQVDPAKPAPNHKLQLSVTMIRFTHDIDWPLVTPKAFGGTKTCTYGGEIYYELATPKWLKPVIGSQTTIHIYPVDGRTVICMESERRIKKLIDAKKEKRQKPKWYEQWRQVEQGVFSVVCVDVQKKLKGKLAVETLDPHSNAEVQALCGALEKISTKIDSMVMGLDAGDSLSLRIRLNAATPEDIPMISQQCESMRKTVKAGTEDPNNDFDRRGKIEAEFLLGLTKEPSMHLTGQSVAIDIESAVAMKAFNQLIKEMFP